MKDIRIISGDDWSGLFIDGKLVAEDHRISLSEFADAVGVPLIIEEANEAGREYLDRCGYFPETLKEWRDANHNN